MTRNSRVVRGLCTAALAASVARSASAASQPRRPPDPITRTSRPVRLLRTWSDTVKVEGTGREYPRTVRLVFDYGVGEAREESYDTHGILRATRRIKQNLPAPSPEEIAEAFDITRRDAGLASVFARFAVALDGGFLLEEEAGLPCGPGSRCLHVFLMSSDRAGIIRRVVVDLVRQTIAYPVYTPSTATMGPER